MKTENPRWIALQVLLRVLDQGRSLDEVLNGEWYQSLKADKRDLAMSRELVFGCCRWYFTLSMLLAERLQKPLRARDLDVEIILVLGLYQLLVLGTGQHAAVNETVKLAQLQKKVWARGLVNALLRGVIRDELVIDQEDGGKSYPDWILGRIHRDWGDQAERVLNQGIRRPPMTLRVDTSRVEINAILENLRTAGIEADSHPVVQSAIQLKSPCEVGSLPGFDTGLLNVQDAAAQIAAVLLECPADARVLDACAAPGGKTLHLLQRYPGIRLDALDSSEIRLQRLRQNLERAGASAGILVGDAAEANGWYSGEPYDRILADLPCSASGVMRRHPDIKLLRRESDIMPLLALQRKILDTLWRLLKPGGQMLYSTCSIFKDENEIQVGKFIERHADCTESDLSQADWGQASAHGRQILTGSENMDGFYYALLNKKVTLEPRF